MLVCSTLYLNGGRACFIVDSWSFKKQKGISFHDASLIFCFFLFFLFLSPPLFHPTRKSMQPTSTSSSSLFSKRSTSMARASVFVDPQPTTPQSEDYARPSSIFTTTTSRQPNLVENTSKSSSALLAPIGVRRAFGELTNHHRQQQQQPDTPRFQSHKKLPLSSNNLMAFNPQHAPPPTKPQQQQQQDDNPSSSSSRFHAHSFDPFGTGMDPFGLNQLGLAANTAPFGQST